VYYVNFRKI